MRILFLAAAATLLWATAAQCDDRLPLSIGTFESLPIINIKEVEPLPAGDSGLIATHARATLSADTVSLVAGNNRFALDMSRSLSTGKNADKNVFVSPFSISAALAMTYAGARGHTAEQMAHVLGFTLPDDRLHPAFGQLLKDLTAPRDGYQLSIANRLFGQAGYPFEKPFLNTTAQSYGAPLEMVSFASDPDGSRRRINEWVESQTNNKITKLLPDGSVTSETRLVLTNAIYFNGQWKYKFDSDATHDDAFFGAAGRQSQVRMMSQQQSFRYAVTPSYQMLEMPYAGDDLSMVLILPNGRDGLAAVENSLTADGMQQSLDALQTRLVNVRLPKFKFDSSFKIGPALADMGMTDAFDPDLADFSGMTTSEQLSIGTALHKAFIDVNEQGTEAVAATAIGMIMTTCACGPPRAESFVADHPFLFAIRDVHSESLLFLGRLTDPGQLALDAAAAVPEPASVVLGSVCFCATTLLRRRRVGELAFRMAGDR